MRHSPLKSSHEVVRVVHGVRATPLLRRALPGAVRMLAAGPGGQRAVPRGGAADEAPAAAPGDAAPAAPGAGRAVRAPGPVRQLRSMHAYIGQERRRIRALSLGRYLPCLSSSRPAIIQPRLGSVRSLLLWNLLLHALSTALQEELAEQIALTDAANDGGGGPAEAGSGGLRGCCASCMMLPAATLRRAALAAPPLPPLGLCRSARHSWKKLATAALSIMPCPLTHTIRYTVECFIPILVKTILPTKMCACSCAHA